MGYGFVASATQSKQSGTGIVNLLIIRRSLENLLIELICLLKLKNVVMADFCKQSCTFRPVGSRRGDTGQNLYGIL